MNAVYCIHPSVHSWYLWQWLDAIYHELYSPKRSFPPLCIPGYWGLIFTYVWYHDAFVSWRRKPYRYVIELREIRVSIRSRIRHWQRFSDTHSLASKELALARLWFLLAYRAEVANWNSSIVITHHFSCWLIAVLAAEHFLDHWKSYCCGTDLLINRFQ